MWCDGQAGYVGQFGALQVLLCLLDLQVYLPHGDALCKAALDECLQGRVREELTPSLGTQTLFCAALLGGAEEAFGLQVRGALIGFHDAAGGHEEESGEKKEKTHPLAPPCEGGEYIPLKVVMVCFHILIL